MPGGRARTAGGRRGGGANPRPVQSFACMSALCRARGRNWAGWSSPRFRVMPTHPTPRRRPISPLRQAQLGLVVHSQVAVLDGMAQLGKQFHPRAGFGGRVRSGFSGRCRPCSGHGPFLARYMAMSAWRNRVPRSLPCSGPEGDCRCWRRSATCTPVDYHGLLEGPDHGDCRLHRPDRHRRGAQKYGEFVPAQSGQNVLRRPAKVLSRGGDPTQTAHRRPACPSESLTSLKWSRSSSNSVKVGSPASLEPLPERIAAGAVVKAATIQQAGQVVGPAPSGPGSPGRGRASKETQVARTAQRG